MQKSTNRTLIGSLICIGSLLLLGTLEHKSNFISFFTQLNTNSTPCAAGSPPLRVYMYDLPPRFNVRMLDPTFPGDSPVTAANIPAWRWNDRLLKQHSLEYWMMASLLYHGSTRDAIRVSDPDSADVFFVPFFSSFSFNFYGLKMKEPNTVDEKLQLEIVNILKESEYWKRSEGRDHIIPLHHPNAFRHYRDRLNASIFVVADFGRILKISRLAKDVVAPYPHMVESYVNDEREDAFESRTTLLFFRGGTKRKDEGKIRAQLHEMFNGTKNVIFEEGHASKEGFNVYKTRMTWQNQIVPRHPLSEEISAEQMRSSKFCLHPAGDTPSSCRLFDAIVSHCVPVIVSDRIELPFEDELDYKEFSIFFSVNEALKPGHMVTELGRVSREEWVEMWMRLKTISHHFEFNYPPKKGDAVDMIWGQVKHKVPSVKLAVHRNRRLKIPDWWRR